MPRKGSAYKAKALAQEIGRSEQELEQTGRTQRLSARPAPFKLLSSHSAGIDDRVCSDIGSAADTMAG
jgi:hypothetical protein